MAGAQSDPMKWKLPGWRIEQAFSNKTLIGNWVEEREKVFMLKLIAIFFVVILVCTSDLPIF